MNYCGRTAQNSTLTEALVFHQTLSTLKVDYIGWSHRAHPKGELEQSTFFHPGSNNENKFTSLSPFQTTIVLENTLLQYQIQSAEFKQRNWNKHLTIRYKDPSVPTRRILHTIAWKVVMAWGVVNSLLKISTTTLSKPVRQLWSEASVVLAY